MNATAFDIGNSKRVEVLVCEGFGCNVADIIGFKNTFFKKAVVFLLVKKFGYNKRNIGLYYQITYLYVPTVVAELEWQYDNVLGFKYAVDIILKKLENEEKKNLDSARKCFIKKALP